MHAGIFLAPFSFYKKIPQIFSKFQNPLENYLNIFSSKVLNMHQSFKVYNHWKGIWPNGGTSGATLGPADPRGRSTQGQWLLGPTFSNGSITVVACLSSGARAIFSLNRGREGCWALSYSLTLPLTHSCSGFHWILAQVWFQEISLSHFFAARLITYLEEQLSGKNFILISLT